MANSWTRPVARTEHKVGHVHARHQKHEPHGDEQQLQRTARRRHQILPQRNRDDGTSACGRPALFHRLAQGSELRLGVLHTYPVSQPTDDSQGVVLLEGVSREVIWEPRIHVANNRILGARGRDSHHFVRFSVQMNGRANDQRIAVEARSPEPIAQYHAASANLVGKAESRTAQRARLERPEIVVRHLQHTKSLSDSTLDQVESCLASTC